MPVRKVKGGYKWGKHGKVYPTKKQAEEQARAAYANGYKGYDNGGIVTPDKMKALQAIADSNRGVPPLAAQDILSMGAASVGQAYKGLTDPLIQAGKENVIDPIIQQMSVERAIPESIPGGRDRLKQYNDEVSQLVSENLFDPLNIIPAGALAKAGKTAKNIKNIGKLEDASRYILRTLSEENILKNQAEFIAKNKGKLPELSRSPLYYDEPLRPTIARPEDFGAGSKLSETDIIQLRKDYPQTTGVGDDTVTVTDKIEALKKILKKAQ